MTAHRIWAIRCDNCGETFATGENRKLIQIRNAARRRSWASSTFIRQARDEPDFCPAPACLAAAIIRD